MNKRLLQTGIYLLLLLPFIAKGQQGNPLFADPTIFYYDGVYYLYGTNGANSNDGFTACTSKDLTSWKPAGKVLTPGQSFGTKGFWAPQVFRYNGRFYMAYTASEHIAIAVADNPLGPFRQKEIKPLDATVRMIDPFVFFDEGKVYLYHVRLQQGNRIFVAELNTTLDTIIATTAKECIHAGKGWENTAAAEWSVTEGPTVFQHDGVYYMLYSANDFRNPDYAIGYAVSHSPVGPWTKFKGNPIISRKVTGANGSGHGDLFKDKAGKWWYVFHTHYSNEKVAPRKTALIELLFNKKNNELSADPKTFHFLNNNQ
ncbi:MAG: glycoside hydrolase family 43 protein [Niabella sp.]|nr:glycoside hydrolase family 43 protein [Niabella sp.]